MAIFTILLSKNKTNYLVDIKGVYFGKILKKPPEFKNLMCCLICFPCFRFKFCHAEQRKENDPRSNRSFRLSTQQHVTRNTKRTHNIQANDHTWRLDLCLYFPTKHLLSVHRFYRQLAAMVSHFGNIFSCMIQCTCIYLVANKLLNNTA